MTAIALKKETHFTKVMVNGRVAAYAQRISEITKHGSYTWKGMANGKEFEIFGGKKSGGRKNEWFVRWAPISSDDYLPVHSAVQAIKYIEQS